MAYIYFDSYYAPCGFLIVRKDSDPYCENDTRLIQTDWDYPGIANAIGWTPCHCGTTDGTVNCKHKTASSMISEAYEYIRDHEGEEFDQLENYLE